MLSIAETLDDAGLDIVEDIVEIVKVECLRPPAAAELYAIARRVRADMEPRSFVLPSGEGIPMPEWVKAKVQAMIERHTAARDVVDEVEIERRKQLARRYAEARTRTGGVRLVEVEPAHPCDRCDHPLRRHGFGIIETSACKDKACPCDGFFPKAVAS